MLNVGQPGLLLPAMVLDKSFLRLIEPHRRIEEIAKPGACLFMLIAGFVSLDVRERVTPLRQAAGSTQP